VPPRRSSFPRVQRRGARSTSGRYSSEDLIRRLATALESDEDELLILAKKIPPTIRERVFERPEAFSKLARLDDAMDEAGAEGDMIGTLRRLQDGVPALYAGCELLSHLWGPEQLDRTQWPQQRPMPGLPLYGQGVWHTALELVDCAFFSWFLSMCEHLRERLCHRIVPHQAMLADAHAYLIGGAYRGSGTAMNASTFPHLDRLNNVIPAAPRHVPGRQQAEALVGLRFDLEGTDRLASREAIKVETGDGPVVGKAENVPRVWWCSVIYSLSAHTRTSPSSSISMWMTFGQQQTGQSSTCSWCDPAATSIGTTISSPQESHW